MGRRDRGIIPAHAGSRRSTSPSTSIPRDHPRACGEQTCTGCPQNGHGGSSPRMRGAGRAEREHRPVPRIIPAHAGSSLELSDVRRLGRDHPRACGEQPSRATSATARCGSSPRMRGAEILLWVIPAAARIIPAHAGSRIRTAVSDRSAEDHPRACGEQWGLPPIACFTRGSSPRMRGADRRGGRDQQERRIIPAHAGSSWPLSDAPAETPGSSPRMWGAGHVKRPQGNRFRIIPAHAGSRSSGTGPTSGRRDHPRACGEQVVLASGTMSVSGSSPRMRGAASLPRETGRQARIIPAHAGSRGGWYRRW